MAEQARARIDNLSKLSLGDDQPRMEGPNLTVQMDTEPEFNYADARAYESSFVGELAFSAELSNILSLGQTHLNTLYSYRSCSKALPNIDQGMAEDEKKTIYEEIVAVLEPEIEKLRTILRFQEESTARFISMVLHMAQVLANGDVPSLTFGWRMIQVVDLFALLDDLKNMKACLNNDFSFFKRASTYLRQRGASQKEDASDENHKLYLFLAVQSSITQSLREQLLKMTNDNGCATDDVLIALVSQCADWTESGQWTLLPGQKHTLLRVVPYFLNLLDSLEGFNVFRSKKVKLDRFVKLFRLHPVVPLFGDMQIDLEAVLRRAPNFEERALSGSSSARTEAEYLLTNSLKTDVDAHNAFVARHAALLNEIRVAMKLASKQQEAAGGMIKLPLPLCRRAADVTMEGLRLLAHWSGRVSEQAAYKYAHPNQRGAGAEGSDEWLDYERAVRYNYTDDERLVLVRYLGLIKGLADVLLRGDALLAGAVGRAVHDETQQMVQVHSREILRYATKKKRAQLREHMMRLREETADWSTGIEPVDPALHGKKDDKKSPMPPLPARSVRPSSTQLELARASIHTLLMTRKREGVDSKQAAPLEEWLRASYGYDYLLNVPATVQECADLGDLWYREFYLELSKRLQFPIEASLPWMLMSHILDNQERHPAMLEYVFYPLDVYNDAAYRALHVLRQRFLYDEIEAETSLVFEQLVFKLAERMFLYFKNSAGALMIDKLYRTKMIDDGIYGAHRVQAPRSRYDAICRQRHVQLLGRTIDLNALIAQRFNTFLRENVEHAVARFESQDLSAVIELENAFRCVRLAHRLMSVHFSLDPMDDIIDEVCEATSLISFQQRLALHAIGQLVGDLAPNTSYNSDTHRFVRSPVAMVEPMQRAPMPKLNTTYLFGNKALSVAFETVHQRQRAFVGMPHVKSLQRVLGDAYLPLVVAECVSNVRIKIEKVLAPYIHEIRAGMPPQSKLPRAEYGTDGCFGYFSLQLKEIMEYPDLQPELLQSMREIGNLLAFVALLDVAQREQRARHHVLAAPFLNQRPGASDEGSETAPLFRVHRDLAAHTNTPLATQLATSAWQADKYYRPYGSSLSLMRQTIAAVALSVDSLRDQWAPPPPNRVLAIDSSDEFARLWSALLFCFCSPPAVEKEESNYELFGDAPCWTASCIMHLLGQRNHFELFDFGRWLLVVDELDRAAGKGCDKKEVVYFLRRAAHLRSVHDAIFDLCAATFPRPRDDSEIVMFKPPKSNRAPVGVTVAPSSQGKGHSSYSSPASAAASTLSAPVAAPVAAAPVAAPVAAAPVAAPVVAPIAPPSPRAPPEPTSGPEIPPEPMELPRSTPPPMPSSGPPPVPSVGPPGGPPTRGPPHGRPRVSGAPPARRIPPAAAPRPMAAPMQPQATPAQPPAAPVQPQAAAAPPPMPPQPPKAPAAPKMPAKKLGGGGGKPPARGGLLSSIEGFKKGALKKAVTVDKSAPIKSSSGGGSGGGGGGAPPAGGLMAAIAARKAKMGN